ncbi:MAG: hypothetical protein Q8891_10145 [Bacteroidota bacterium]|nr:hypothetical protein [Bacteroidota bacterium]
MKIIRLKGPDGIISEGKYFEDSLFDGKVKYFDSLNEYLGYSTYRYGVKDGPEVSYFKNGKISDSSFYHDDLRNGFAYRYNKNGTLVYKSYYINDRPFGHLYEYDSLGRITHYYFINFERKIIFETFKKDTVDYAKGEEIQGNTYSEDAGQGDDDFLFLYLFANPFLKSHYEIGIVDSSKKIISSKLIYSKDCYYEQELKILPNGEKYAIILHTYNPYKKKDDLKIRIIE